MTAAELLAAVEAAIQLALLVLERVKSDKDVEAALDAAIAAWKPLPPPS